MHHMRCHIISVFCSISRVFPWTGSLRKLEWTSTLAVPFYSGEFNKYCEEMPNLMWGNTKKGPTVIHCWAPESAEHMYMQEAAPVSNYADMRLFCSSFGSNTESQRRKEYAAEIVQFQTKMERCVCLQQQSSKFTTCSHLVVSVNGLLLFIR